MALPLSIRVLLLTISSKIVFGERGCGAGYWSFCPVHKQFSSTRKQNKLNKYIETQKEMFTQLDLQDVEVREKIKHSKSKSKKLQKQLEKEQEKVCPPF